MNRLLNSDMLGTKGENRFGELCADALLHANKVGTDRTGWDFYVEFPFPNGSEVHRLDSRPQPPEFKVQVKTVWANAKNVKLRLSSAERLAKWAGAAFVIVLVVDDSTLEFTSMHLLHVRREILSTILKALRACERDDSTQVNHRFVRLNHRRDGDALPVTGAAFRQHVSIAVGTDPSRYAAEKQAERDNLGVKGARYSIAMTLNASDESEAADIMLGLKRGRFSQLLVEETRWGITLPKDTEGPGEVSIRPGGHQARLTLRAGTMAVSEDVVVTLPADYRFKPGTAKMRVHGEAFEMLFDQATGKLSYSFRPDAALGASIGLWQRMVKAQVLLLSGGELHLKASGKPLLILKPEPNEPDASLARLHDIRQLLDKIAVIADAAGETGFKMNAGDLNAAWPQIEFLHELLTTPATAHITPLHVAPSASFPKELRTLDGLVLGRFPLRGHQMAWCAVAPVEFHGEAGGRVRLDVGELSLRRVDLLEDGDEAFDDFTNLVQDETDIRLVMDVGDMTRS